MNVEHAMDILNAEKWRGKEWLVVKYDGNIIAVHATDPTHAYFTPREAIYIAEGITRDKGEGHALTDKVRNREPARSEDA